MWPNDDKKDELQKRISAMCDEELIEMVHVDADDYRTGALRIARAELDARGISFVQLKPVGLTGEKPAGGTTCSCGGPLISGSLFSNQEVTVCFPDREERFVEVLVCRCCRRVQLLVDFETEVVG